MHGNFPNNAASILNSTRVCNSYVHIVDAVLLPTASLATVPAPGNGLNNSAAAPAPTAGALFPGLNLGHPVQPAGACPQAFLNTSTQHNLTFLVQVTPFFCLLAPFACLIWHARQ